MAYRIVITAVSTRAFEGKPKKFSENLRLVGDELVHVKDIVYTDGSSILVHCGSSQVIEAESVQETPSGDIGIVMEDGTKAKITRVPGVVITITDLDAEEAAEEDPEEEKPKKPAAKAKKKAKDEDEEEDADGDGDGDEDGEEPELTLPKRGAKGKKPVSKKKAKDEDEDAEEDVDADGDEDAEEKSTKKGKKVVKKKASEDEDVDFDAF